jgi:hypothetical protein
MWVAPPRDAASFSVWFERSIAAAKIAARRIGLLVVAGWLLLGVAVWASAVSTFDGDRGRELRRILDVERNTFGGSQVAELTDAEADRAWELIQDMFWSALPWMILLGAMFVVVSAWSIALAVRAMQSRRAAPHLGEQVADPLGAVIGGAVRRLPAVIGSGLVLFLVVAGVWAVASLPVVVVATVGGGGAAIVLTAVFVGLAVVTVTAWLSVRLSLAPVIAAIGDHGIGVRRSWNLTRGQFWYSAGRLIITGLIAGAASGVINSVTGFGQLLGFAVYLAIVCALQAVAAAASVVITAAGHLVTVDQLDARR